MVEECDQYKLWFRQDSVFLAPRGEMVCVVVIHLTDLLLCLCVCVCVCVCVCAIAYIRMLFRTTVHLESPQKCVTEPSLCTNV